MKFIRPKTDKEITVVNIDDVIRGIKKHLYATKNLDCGCVDYVILWDEGVFRSVLLPFVESQFRSDSFPRKNINYMGMGHSYGEIEEVYVSPIS